MKTKEQLSNDLKNKVDDELGNTGVYNQGIEGLKAANDLKRDLGETKKRLKSVKKTKKETDESTDSGSSGAFSSPLFSDIKEDKIPGGLAQGMDVVDIVTHHGKDSWASIQFESLEKKIKKELEKGIKIEMEHTTDRRIAQEIALDHLYEDPDYYSKLKKVETNEATDSSSSGQYSTPAAWAKSTSKKDWRGKSKPQIPGGKFVKVKEKCKKFPYCNQGDTKALKMFENETVKRVISSVSKKFNITENVVKSIISYEYENLKSNNLKK